MFVVLIDHKMTTRSRKRGEIRKGLVNFDRYEKARTERALIPRIRGGVAASLLLLERGKNFKESLRWDTHSLDDISIWEDINYRLHTGSQLSFYPTITSEILVDHQITDTNSVTFR